MTLSDDVKAGKQLAAMTVGLSLECCGFGNKRMGDLREVRTDADKARLTLHKTLLKNKALSQIDAHDWQTQKHIRELALPSYFKDGTYRMPLALVSEVDTYLNERLAERRELVEAFRPEYPKAIADAQAHLGPQFRAADYPTADAMVGRISMEWFWFELDGVPASVAAMNGQAASRARRRLNEKLAQLVGDVERRLTADVQALIGEMLEKLAGKGDGEPKQFKQGLLLTRITEYLRTYEARLGTMFPDLTAEIAKLRGVLGSVDLEDAKRNLGTQVTFHEQLADVSKAIDNLMVTRGRRAITLED